MKLALCVCAHHSCWLGDQTGFHQYSSFLHNLQLTNNGLTYIWQKCNDNSNSLPFLYSILYRVYGTKRPMCPFKQLFIHYHSCSRAHAHLRPCHIRLSVFPIRYDCILPTTSPYRYSSPGTSSGVLNPPCSDQRRPLRRTPALGTWLWHPCRPNPAYRRVPIGRGIVPPHDPSSPCHQRDEQQTLENTVGMNINI